MRSMLHWLALYYHRLVYELQHIAHLITSFTILFFFPAAMYASKWLSGRCSSVFHNAWTWQGKLSQSFCITLILFSNDQIHHYEKRGVHWSSCVPLRSWPSSFQNSLSFIIIFSQTSQTSPSSLFILIFSSAGKTTPKFSMNLATAARNKSGYLSIKRLAHSLTLRNCNGVHVSHLSCKRICSTRAVKQRKILLAYKTEDS